MRASGRRIDWNGFWERRSLAQQGGARAAICDVCPAAGRRKGWKHAPLRPHQGGPAASSTSVGFAHSLAAWCSVVVLPRGGSRVSGKVRAILPSGQTWVLCKACPLICSRSLWAPTPVGQAPMPRFLPPASLQALLPLTSPAVIPLCAPTSGQGPQGWRVSLAQRYGWEGSGRWVNKPQRHGMHSGSRGPHVPEHRGAPGPREGGLDGICGAQSHVGVDAEAQPSSCLQALALLPPFQK